MLSSPCKPLALVANAELIHKAAATSMLRSCSRLLVALANAELASIKMNGARLEASCVDSAAAAVTDWGLESPLSGLVVDGFLRTNVPPNVTARFTSVPPSCSGIGVGTPCVAPSGDLRPPLFFCAATGHYGTKVTGPYRATATNIYIGDQFFTHQSELSCPLPTFDDLLMLTGYEGDGFGHNLTLSVRHFTADRVIAYEGIPGLDVVQYTNLPFHPPPLAPPPTPPPPGNPYGPGSPSESCTTVRDLGDQTSGTHYISNSATGGSEEEVVRAHSGAPRRTRHLHALGARACAHSRTHVAGGCGLLDV